MDATYVLSFILVSILIFWFLATMISPLQPTTFSSSSPLTISYAPSADVLLAYYAGTDSNIYQYIGRSASTAFFPTAISSNFTGHTTPGWTNKPNNVTRGAGGIVSIGFEDQVMVFSAEGGEVDMSNLNTTSGVFLPGIAI